VVYCSVCKTELSRETKIIEKLGHSFTNYVSNNDATCTADGTKTAKCDRCEVTDTIADAGSAKGHTEKTVNAKKASCKASGYTGDVVCSVCNEVISKGTVIAKLAHKKVVDKAVAATCTKTGLTEGSHCSVCGTVIKKQTTVAKKVHSYKNVVTKADATKKKSGKITPTCSVCGYKKTATTIYYPKTATLSYSSKTYTGKALKPTVTVKDSKGKTISSKYYTVSYKNNTNVGKATITITFKGNYIGKITKTFTIIPKDTSISKLSAKSKGFTATWKKQTIQTTGYEIQYSTSSKFTSKTTKTIKVTSAKTVSKTVSKLKASSKYYVRVRTYKTVSKTNYYSAWSKALSVKTKK
ncbi:MAG: fibronectin type III domain-containing protein, partial [Oscillospiraceae bacterium]